MIGILACAGPLSPVLYGLGERIAEGNFVAPPTLWRSSPRGVDLLALVEFNPNHAIARWFDPAAAAGPNPEYTGSFSLVVLAVVGIAVWRGGYRPRTGWVLLTAGFATLSLGPFIHVAGFNTFIPGPWAILRYVPIIGIARSPTRFALVATLGADILFAGALAALGRRYPARRRLMTAIIGIVLMLELLPAPRTLYSAAIPSIYDIVAADTRSIRLVQLPFGVRDGASSVGNFNARYQYYQTRHGKALIGGYLSRISRNRVGAMRAQPTLDALITMSEGSVLEPAQAERFRALGPKFIARANVGYVVIHHAYTSAYLVKLVSDAWGLREIAREGDKALYVPEAGGQ